MRRNDHSNSYLQNAWNKYGESCFEFSVLEQCTEEDLDDKECAYIRLFDSMNRDKGYNLESGGHVNKHMSDESKARMSKAKDGMYCGTNNPMYGVHLKHSEKWKQWASKRFSGVNNPNYGKHFQVSDETRRKLSEANRGERNGFYGKHHTEEAKRRMSEKKRGMKWSLEDILKRGQNKRVRCLNNGMEFESLSLAAQWAGTTAPESISRVCYKKQKTAGFNPETKEKYTWEFI